MLCFSSCFYFHRFFCLSAEEKKKEELKMMKAASDAKSPEAGKSALAAPGRPTAAAAVARPTAATTGSPTMQQRSLTLRPGQIDATPKGTYQDLLKMIEQLRAELDATRMNADGVRPGLFSTLSSEC